MAGWFSSAMSWLGLVDDLQGDEGQYADTRYGGGVVTETDDTTDPLEAVSSITATELPPNITKITDIAPRRTPELRVMPHPEPQPVSEELPVILHAFSYSDMEVIGKQFRSGRAVVMNLVGMSDRKELRRLIDFSSGMVFALDGKATKVADRVFLLTPHGVQVAAGFMERLGAEMARSA
ncbi:MAG: cell division protein SepF [Propionibacteriaceae bacterium]|jgi:cell division inhibitor SepF|nr:cell division protein SepF [Propionibacteriaceae bacterium]